MRKKEEEERNGQIFSLWAQSDLNKEHECTHGDGGDISIDTVVFTLCWWRKIWDSEPIQCQQSRSADQTEALLRRRLSGPRNVSFSDLRLAPPGYHDGEAVM